METFERIKELCKNRGVSVQRLEIELGEKPSSIAKISSNSKGEKLYKIAQYFGVSMEYLITGSAPAAPFVISDEEKAIIMAYRKKSEDAKDIVASSLGVKRQDTGLQSSKVSKKRKAVNE